MVHHELSSLEPTQTAFTKQNAILDEILAQTPMKSPLCTNWYRTEQGRITVSSTLSASELEEEVREIKWEDWVAREVVESDGKTTADIVDMASRPRLAEVQERQGTAIAALVALVVIRSGRYVVSTVSSGPSQKSDSTASQGVRLVPRLSKDLRVSGIIKVRLKCLQCCVFVQDSTNCEKRQPSSCKTDTEPF